MLTASYNKNGMGDNLIVITNPDVQEQQYVKNGNVVRIFDSENNKTIGFNFLKASTYLPHLINNSGKIDLTADQVTSLNQYLVDNNLEPELIKDNDNKLVVGYVERITKHPQSDHLLIAETNIGNDEVLSIVSGSPNMKEHIKVVVAKTGSLLPNGMLIFPSTIVGVKCEAMIVSGYELELHNAPKVKGALILPDDDRFEIGKDFNLDEGNKLFN